MRYYQGKFTPKRKTKYIGDVGAIYYRSSLELQLFIWCDKTDSIKHWSSEEIVIPYRCPVDGKIHRYFVDALIEFESGKKILIEIKPERYTLPPKQGKNKRKFLLETMEYARNRAKWEAADNFAKHNKIEFKVWTEKTLKELGITIETKPPKSNSNHRRVYKRRRVLKT